MLRNKTKKYIFKNGTRDRIRVKHRTRHRTRHRIRFITKKYKGGKYKGGANQTSDSDLKRAQDAATQAEQAQTKAAEAAAKVKSSLEEIKLSIKSLKVDGSVEENVDGNKNQREITTESELENTLKTVAPAGSEVEEPESAAAATVGGPAAESGSTAAGVGTPGSEGLGSAGVGTPGTEGLGSAGVGTEGSGGIGSAGLGTEGVGTPGLGTPAAGLGKPQRKEKKQPRISPAKPPELEAAKKITAAERPTQPLKFVQKITENGKKKIEYKVPESVSPKTVEQLKTESNQLKDEIMQIKPKNQTYSEEEKKQILEKILIYLTKKNEYFDEKQTSDNIKSLNDNEISEKQQIATKIVKIQELLEKINLQTPIQLSTEDIKDFLNEPKKS